MAAFEGLLPAPHDERVLNLLFVFAQWHGLAKLRIHTDHTLAMLDDLTTELGDGLRGFVHKTCSVITTKELNREYQARKRREARQKGKKTTKGKGGQVEKRQKTGDDNSSENPDPTSE